MSMTNKVIMAMKTQEVMEEVNRMWKNRWAVKRRSFSMSQQKKSRMDSWEAEYHTVNVVQSFAQFMEQIFRPRIH